MVILIKKILQGGLFLIVKRLPFKTFCSVRDAYAKRARSGHLLDHYIERIINHFNRRALTEKCRAQGVPCFSDGPDDPHEARYRIYDYVFSKYVREPVDYLEFGVAQGKSMRWALSKFSSASHLYGFDSFEGLPQDWYRGFTRGTFSNKGVPPPLHAPNLTFVKGWFEDSLQPFLASTQLKPRLVLHMDADLYAPTKYVLSAMMNLLVPGTIIIFDEYWFLKDEFRALQEFVRETGKQFKYLAVSDARAAVQLTT